ncbi:unnamed protein product [Leptosia nina]|uniref:Uncharacterized protein n=1 Tax=Leptosia nina TaxID=320188 RepID=A0AAV1JU81_9NEOP
MFRENRREYFCYRANLNNQKKVRKGTQLSPGYEDVSISPLRYKTKTNATETDSKKQNLCKCRPKTTRRKQRSKNHDTTIVWEDSSPVNYKNEGTENIFYDIIEDKQRKRKFKLSKNKRSYEINSRRKHNNRIENEIKVADQERIIYGHVEPLIGENVLDGDDLHLKKIKTCQKGICKTNIEEGKKHHCKCKTVKKRPPKVATTTTCTNYSCALEGGIKRRYNKLISCLFNSKHNVAPKPVIVEKGPVQPMFAIRVDSGNLQILNPNEIRTKVKALGNVAKHDKCMCPSRLERAKKYGIGETCEDGVCETARKGKYDHFNCNCEKTAIIECCDRTCDIKTPGVSTNQGGKIVKKITANGEKPVFEMLLDQNHMNVLNTGEIHDVLKKASLSDMCPTGICRDTENTDRILNCKCLSKKISPILHECHKGTCRPNETITEEPKKKSRFYLCTRICSSFGKQSCKCPGYRNAQGDVIYGRRNAIGTTPDQPAERERSNLCFVTRICSSLGKWRYSGGDMNARGIRRKKLADKKRRKKKQRNEETVRKRKKKPVEKDKKRKPKQDQKVKGKEKKQKSRKVEPVIKATRKYSFWTRSETSEKKANAQKTKAQEEKLRKAELKKKKEDKKIQERAKKEAIKRRKKIAKLQSQGQTNCLARFIIGVVNLSLGTLSGLATMLVYIIAKPIRSYAYVKQKLKDPIGSFKMLKSWISTTWKARDSNFTTAIQDSHVVHILSDQLEESALFQVFTNKGQTPEEKQMYERMKKKRQRRMRKRHEQALYSCRHMLLVTLRKHPWICVYHLCPDFYPHCLSLLTFLTNFFHLLLFLLALLCWTPCIMCMEVVRAFLCCVVCTH